MKCNHDADKELCDKCKLQAEIERLKERNDTLHKDYDTLVEVISEQDAEITRLKSNQSKFSG